MATWGVGAPDTHRNIPSPRLKESGQKKREPGLVLVKLDACRQGVIWRRKKKKIKMVRKWLSVEVLRSWPAGCLWYSVIDSVSNVFALFTLCTAIASHQIQTIGKSPPSRQHHQMPEPPSAAPDRQRRETPSQIKFL